MSTFKDTKKLVLLGVLSALGAILMLIEIPYPPFPFLKFDISDLAILLVAVILGLKPAIIAAIIKSLVSLMVRGMNSPLGIGLIAAALSSIALAGVYVAVNKCLKGEKWGLKLLRLGLIITIYSMLMTVFNYLFITPIFLTGGNAIWFTQLDASMDVGGILGVPFEVGYGAAMVFIYFPFNAIKSGFVLTLYEIMSPRLLPVLRKIIKN